MYLILNKDLDIVAEITTFSSINWEEEYLSQSGGDFEIILPSSDYSYLNIEEGFIIYKTNSLKFGLVNYIEYTDTFTEDEEVQQLITLKGEMGESILKRRVISPQLNKTGTIDEIFKSVIGTHFTNPRDSKRRINLEYIESDYKNKVSKCITGCTVAQLFESICSSKEYSYRVFLDLENKKFYCKLIAGNNKSDSVIFSKNDDNLSSFTYVKSKENFISHIVVAGEGTGQDRTMVTISNSNLSGLDRIESYLDKNNVSSEGLDTKTYVDKLKEEGKTELNKYSSNEAIEFDILLNNYEVGVDFDLGDKVKIINENLGIETTTRVLAILYSTDENGIETIQLTLGNIEEIELEEDETTTEKEEDTTDTTNDKVVTSVNTQYIPIYAIDEEGNTLTNLEFPSGFFKITDNTFCMVIKNNTSKTISKIYYTCEENLLQSEDAIFINSSTAIDCYEGHSVDSDSKHFYNCNIREYDNLVKVVVFGDAYSEPTEEVSLIEITSSYTDYEVLKTIYYQPSIQGWADVPEMTHEYGDYTLYNRRFLGAAGKGTTRTIKSVTKDESGNLTYCNSILTIPELSFESYLNLRNNATIFKFTLNGTFNNASFIDKAIDGTGDIYLKIGDKFYKTGDNGLIALSWGDIIEVVWLHGESYVSYENDISLTIEGATDAKLGINCSGGSSISDDDGNCIHYVIANPNASTYSSYGITEGFCGDNKYTGSFTSLQNQMGNTILDNCTYTTQLDTDYTSISASDYLHLSPFYEYCDAGWCH